VRADGPACFCENVAGAPGAQVLSECTLSCDSCNEGPPPGPQCHPAMVGPVPVAFAATADVLSAAPNPPDFLAAPVANFAPPGAPPIMPAGVGPCGTHPAGLQSISTGFVAVQMPAGAMVGTVDTHDVTVTYAATPGGNNVIPCQFTTTVIEGGGGGVAPSLSEWGAVLVVLSGMILGTLALRRREAALAAGVAGDLPSNHALVADRELLARLLVLAAGVWVVACAAAYLAFGELALRDLVGGALTAGAAAYLLHLWLATRRDV